MNKEEKHKIFDFLIDACQKVEDWEMSNLIFCKYYKKEYKGIEITICYSNRRGLGKVVLGSKGKETSFESQHISNFFSKKGIKMIKSLNKLRKKVDKLEVKKQRDKKDSETKFILNNLALDSLVSK